MEHIRQYLLSLLTAAVICAIALRVGPKSGTNNSILKLLTGIFLSITVISPLARIKLQDIDYDLTAFRADAQQIVDQAYDDKNSQLRGIITQQLEAYILDKADSFGVTMQAQIALDQDGNTPDSITIQADISPYIKSQMQQIIADDLGIPKEDQIWK